MGVHDDDIIELEKYLGEMLQNYDIIYPELKINLCNWLLDEKILIRSHPSMFFYIQMKDVGRLSRKPEVVQKWLRRGDVRDMIKVIRKCKDLSKLSSQNPYLVDVSQL